MRRVILVIAFSCAVHAQSNKAIRDAPQLIYKTPCEYTAEARKARLEGDVVLRVEIDGGGKPGSVGVVKALDRGLDQKAVECVRAWRWKPAFANDHKAIASRENVTVEYRLPKAK